MLNSAPKTPCAEKQWTGPGRSAAREDIDRQARVPDLIAEKTGRCAQPRTVQRVRRVGVFGSPALIATAMSTNDAPARGPAGGCSGCGQSMAAAPTLPERASPTWVSGGAAAVSGPVTVGLWAVLLDSDMVLSSATRAFRAFDRSTRKPAAHRTEIRLRKWATGRSRAACAHGVSWRRFV